MPDRSGHVWPPHDQPRNYVDRPLCWLRCGAARWSILARLACPQSSQGRTVGAVPGQAPS